MKLFLIGLLFLLNSQAFANVLTDPALPLSHCYHWLDSKAGFLDFKYDHAKTHSNELTFFTTGGNGAVAGSGLYCAKSPSQSYSYGDRVVRLDFVEDVVVLDAETGKKTCGVRGNYYPDDTECQKKNWDVKLYKRNPEWFVIQNPGAIVSWTTNSDVLIRDLKAEMASGDSGYTLRANQTLEAIKTELITNKVPRVFNNGQARISIADILMKDTQKILSIPAVSVLSSLQTMDKNAVPEAQVQWGYTTTVLRILRDPTISPTDVEPFLKEGVVKNLFLSTILDQFPAKNDQQKPLENMNLILAFINERPDLFSAEVTTLAVSKYIKNVANLKSSTKGLHLEPGLKNIFQNQIASLLQTPLQRNNLSNEFYIYNFITKNDFSKNLAEGSLRRIKALIPLDAPSIVYLSDGKNLYGLGSNEAESVMLCSGQIMLNNLFGKNLQVGVDKNTFVKIGSVADSAGLDYFCQQVPALVRQVIQLKNIYSLKSYAISGLIQDKVPFNFFVNTTETFEKAVAEFMKTVTLPSQVDLIKFSVNGGPQRTLSNSSSYWDKTALGRALLAVAPEGLESNLVYDYIQRVQAVAKSKAYQLEGTIQNKPIKFAVDNVDELTAQCKEAVQLYKLKDVDDIQFKVNGQTSPKRTNSQSYWNNEATCKVVKAILAEVIIKQNAKSLKGSMDKYPYHFTVLINDLELPLGGNSYEDIQNQCPALLTKMEIISTDTILLKQNGKPDQKIYNSQSYWNSAKDICANLLKAITTPTIAQLKVLALTAAYKIEAKFQAKEFTFVVNSSAELQTQCCS